MTYADHPLLAGFVNETDDMLRFCIVAQLDLGCTIALGRDLSLEVKTLLEETLLKVERPGLEKFLYHAILAAVDANRKKREVKDG